MKSVRFAASALGLAALLSVSVNGHTQGIFTGIPTDDIWVYGNAGDPGFDPVLRVWGNGASSVAAAYPPDDLSHGYLKWNVAAVPNLAQGQYYQVTEAALTVTSQRANNYTLAQAQQYPLEARPLAANFAEATWLFDDANPNPGEPVLGTGSTANYSASVVYQIPINLLQTPDAFQSAFNAALAGNKQLALALTSKIPAAVMGGAFYRIYSKDDPGGRRPSLRVAYTPVTRLAGTVTLQGAVSASQPITLTFTATDNSTTFTRTVTPAANGAFTVADIPLKSFQIAIKGRKWLRALTNADASQVPQPTLSATLRAGDANDDNTVDITDLLALIAAYNSTTPNAPYLDAADLTGDGTVDITDLLLLIGNYNQTGA